MLNTCNSKLERYSVISNFMFNVTTIYHFFGIFCLLLIVQSAGCACDRKPDAKAILLESEHGKLVSRPTPAFDVWRTLDRAAPGERQHIIDGYVDIIFKDKGYTRFIVLRGILDFADIRQDRERYINQRLVNAVAAYAVRVAGDGRNDLAVTEVLGGYPLRLQEGIFSGEPLTTRPAIESTRWFDKVIDAEFEMVIDGITVKLEELHGWRFGRAKVWLDDKLILDDSNKNYSNKIEISLADSCGRDTKKLLGKHVQRMELQVIAPNGMTAKAKYDRQFDIYDDNKLGPTSQPGTK